MSVVRTVYSFGLEGDHSSGVPRPLSVSAAVCVPAVAIATEVDPEATVVASSTRSTWTVAGFGRALAASIVTVVWSVGDGPSTFRGNANTSAMNTSGTTRSVTSR